MSVNDLGDSPESTTPAAPSTQVVQQPEPVDEYDEDDHDEDEEEDITTPQPDADADADAEVTSQAPAPAPAKDEQKRVEYRDPHGNILDEEQVAALTRQGNVKFETQYETKTMMVDGNGEPHAPPHPDVEGQNPETYQKESDGGVDNPASSGEGDEESYLKKQEEPRPASEGSEAT